MFCGFCGIYCEKIQRSRVLLTQYLEIFRADIGNILLQKFEDSCCEPCWYRLKDCYLFVQQTQIVVASANKENQESEELKKYRIILPKPQPATFETAATAAPSTSVNTKSKRTYQCSNCDEVFGSFRQLKVHSAEHGSEKRSANICQFCCSLYATKEALEKHIRERHADGKFSCPLCADKTYKDKGYLLKHAKAYHNGRLFHCTLCSNDNVTKEVQQFSCLQLLEKHFKETHMSDELDGITTDIDQEELELEEEFLDEFLLHVSNENSFMQFSECWNSIDFSDMLELNNCYETSPTEVTSTEAYTCPKCNVEHFSKLKSLLQHLVRVHGIKLAFCNKCSKSFHNAAELALHKAKEHSEPITTIANANEQQNASETATQRRQQPEHECPYCSKKFHAEANLKQHLRSVHCRLKRHICQLCDRQFSSQDHLKKHVLSQHQNERKHICHVCAKGFTQLCHLKQHLAIHTNGKSFGCSTCNLKFWRKIDVQRHKAKQQCS